MSCLNPPPLTPDQIDAVLGGVAEPAVAEHAAGCPACAARVAEARQAERRLAQRLHRWDCPPAQALADYHFRLLAPEPAAQVAAHTEQCAACRVELGQLRAFLAAEPRPAAEARRRAERPPRPSLGDLIARLLPAQPALALRGGARGTLVAEAGDVTLVLELQAAGGGGLALLGQLAAPNPETWAGALVQLWQAGELQTTGVVDEVGGFRLEGCAPGRAELRFIPAQGPAIVWPDLDLTA
jgi:hypothetical protein